MPFDEQINHYLSSVEIEIPFFIRSSIFLQLFSIAPINSFMENCGDNSHTASYLTLPYCLCTQSVALKFYFFGLIRSIHLIHGLIIVLSPLQG